MGYEAQLTAQLYHQYFLTYEQSKLGQADLIFGL